MCRRVGHFVVGEMGGGEEGGNDHGEDGVDGELESLLAEHKTSSLFSLLLFSLHPSYLDLDSSLICVPGENDGECSSSAATAIASCNCSPVVICNTKVVLIIILVINRDCGLQAQDWGGGRGGVGPLCNHHKHKIQVS